MVKAKKNFCVVAYDIQDDKKRNKIAKILEKYGVRVNYSVFECLFTDSQYIKVQSELIKKIDIRSDSIIFYPVCINCYTKILYQPSNLKSDRKVVEII
ncbi:MAG: CRISPR-associated endonuclease Cas2 [Tannerellaceae bacterium]|nr:CRISPR-associated endonuclease Cas2 [Tannerellaceae bacterium]